MRSLMQPTLWDPEADVGNFGLGWISKIWLHNLFKLVA